MPGPFRNSCNRLFLSSLHTNICLFQIWFVKISLGGTDSLLVRALEITVITGQLAWNTREGTNRLKREFSYLLSQNVHLLTMTRKWMHFLEELAVFALRKVFICISRGVGISQPPRTPSISSPCGSLFCHSVYWVLQRTWQTANLWWKVCVDKSWLYNINICWVDA